MRKKHGLILLVFMGLFCFIGAWAAFAYAGWLIWPPLLFVVGGVGLAWLSVACRRVLDAQEAKEAKRAQEG